MKTTFEYERGPVSPGKAAAIKDFEEKRLKEEKARDRKFYLGLLTTVVLVAVVAIGWYAMNYLF